MAKEKVKAAKAPEVTRAELEALAKEMNEVMGLDPAIKFNRKTTDEALLEMIKAEAVDPESGEPCIYDTDFQEDPEDEEKVVFSEDAEKTLEALGIEIAEEEGDGDGDELADLDMDGLKSYIKENDLDIKVTKKMDEDAVRDLIREAEEKEEEKEEKPAKGAKGKAAKEEKAPAKSEKAPAKAEKEKPAKAAKAAPAKKEKSEKFTRYMSVAAVLKEGKALTEDDLISKADDLYSKKGGNSGIDQSARIVDRSMQLLTALGMVEVKNSKIKYLGE